MTDEWFIGECWNLLVTGELNVTHYRAVSLYFVAFLISLSLCWYFFMLILCQLIVSGELKIYISSNFIIIYLTIPICVLFFQVPSSSLSSSLCARVWKANCDPSWCRYQSSLLRWTWAGLQGCNFWIGYLACHTNTMSSFIVVIVLFSH